MPLFCRYRLSVESAKKSSKKKRWQQQQQQQNAEGQIPRSLSTDKPEVKRKERKRSSQTEDSVPRSVSMVEPREMAKQQKQQKDRLSVPEPTAAATTKVEARRDTGAQLGETSRPVSEEVRVKRSSLPRALKTGEAKKMDVRKSGEVQRSADVEPAAREVCVHVVAKELPISEALAAEPTVTTFKPEVGEKGEAVTTTALVISEKTGETTITMEQVKTTWRLTAHTYHSCIHLSGGSRGGGGGGGAPGAGAPPPPPPFWFFITLFSSLLTSCCYIATPGLASSARNIVRCLKPNGLGTRPRSSIPLRVIIYGAPPFHKSCIRPCTSCSNSPHPQALTP